MKRTIYIRNNSTETIVTGTFINGEVIGDQIVGCNFQLEDGSLLQGEYKQSDKHKTVFTLPISYTLFTKMYSSDEPVPMDKLREDGWFFEKNQFTPKGRLLKLQKTKI